ncbi:D-amino-acid dehydrogenase [Siccirubricoccus deserti]|uniref:FAD-binding oxidoreductase n=1 Tax=Siccirubricoccus deserti TaxID=2013562 RepID=A0A9X0UEW6_9PROT|nr:FAD-binding oxidoreductase [Siccirubricoccus deserti]MBC4017218.1 FAD-binding oxidoreductase [Siccirubricoccus deserti]GGC54469.1 D-amino-acid dehydrogenase [Siccirubricoccus deserti]
MPRSAIVLGAGMVGVSVALHLRRRGYDVVLVDRQGPGEGASFGNGGLIQREAVHPHPFPRAVAELLRIARNRAIDVYYHPLALPGFASPLLRYWWHSEPARYLRTAEAYARLIVTCIDEHLAIARGTDAMDLLRPIGWMRLFSDPRMLEETLARAEVARREHGVNFAALDGAGLAAAEPHLLVSRAGAIHWTDPLSVSDPHALTLSYARLFTEAGGSLAIGDATSLQPAGAGWRVQTSAGPVGAAEVVIALGAASARVTVPLGYAPPLFGKRGYHMHYGLRGNAVLHRPVLDTDSGFLLAPMRAGVRLTTGAEFAHAEAPPSPIQLERAEPVARGLLPLMDRLDNAPWMGVRPCTPDMLPIIGRMPGRNGAWCAFGHAHQGLTLGPTTGRLLAELMTGETPFVSPEPYQPARF